MNLKEYGPTYTMMQVQIQRHPQNRPTYELTNTLSGDKRVLPATPTLEVLFGECDTLLMMAEVFRGQFRFVDSADPDKEMADV